jgi:hypothetical protein
MRTKRKPHTRPGVWGIPPGHRWGIQPVVDKPESERCSPAPVEKRCQFDAVHELTRSTSRCLIRVCHRPVGGTRPMQGRWSQMMRSICPSRSITASALLHEGSARHIGRAETVLAPSARPPGSNPGPATGLRRSPCERYSSDKDRRKELRLATDLSPGSCNLSAVLSFICLRCAG